ncbi:MAG: hypothetical protein OWQ57_13210, partial [Sulfobacillus sp.]|nr:hypothetical protein [Sulfobacillus sp.]
MALLDGEDQQLRRIQEKLTLLRQLLQARDLDPENHDPHEWYRIASTIKRALGNFDNDVSFIASLLAKQFLTEHHHIPLLDVSAKAQGAPGLDFDVRSHNGDRIIAELKTTIPYGENDLGRS